MVADETNFAFISRLSLVESDLELGTFLLLAKGVDNLRSKPGDTLHLGPSHKINR